MEDGETSVSGVRQHLWELVEAPQGYAFISNDFDDCPDWQSLIDKCDNASYHFQVAANRCRAVKRTAVAQQAKGGQGNA